MQEPGPVAFDDAVTWLDGAVRHWAQHRGDAVAARFENRDLDYRTLDANANRLARYLGAHGVRPGAIVGLCVERSLDMLVAVLGVLRAGAAFLPLDPQHPPVRLAMALDDAQATLCVVHGNTQEVLQGHPADVVCLDRDRDRAAIAAQDGAALGIARLPAGAAAYALYTSGSTGRPKGVLVDHAAVTARLRSMQTAMPLRPSDRVLHRTTLAFDVAVEEIFWTWWVGACLVVTDPVLHLDAGYLAAVMKRERVSVVDVVPSVLGKLLDHGCLAGLPALRLLLCGGEAMGANLAARLLQGFAGEAYNVYGPTEAVINATFWRVAPLPEGHAPPIGRGLPDTPVYVLDEALQPVAEGEVGELCIGGAALARGYIGEPAGSAGRFVADPFVPGGRLYRSGDWVRWREGVLEFVGRRDRQIKRMGVRIELDDIEAALSACPGIAQAAVHATAPPTGPVTISAYVVPRTGVMLRVAEVRAHLGRVLPQSWMPSRWAVLGELPLTPTGKIDRLRLPAPSVLSVEPVGADDASPTARWIAECVGGMLGIPVLPNDNFFHLGGDSLAAVELVLEVRSRFDVSLPLQAIFEFPTCAALAARVEALQHKPEADAQRHALTPHLLPLRAGRREACLFCVHPGDGGASPYLPLAEAIEAGRAVYGVAAWNLALREPVRATVTDIAGRYVEQLRHVQPQAPYHLVGWSSGALIAYEMACLLRAEGAEVGTLALIDPYSPWHSDDAQRARRAGPAPIAEDWLFFLDIFGFRRLAGPDDMAQLWRLTGLSERAAYALALLQAERIVPAALTADDFSHLFTLVQASFRALAAYEPPSYAGELTLCLPAQGALDPNAVTFWRSRSHGRVRVTEVPGDHVTMMRHPGAGVMAKALRIEDAHEAVPHAVA